MAEEKAGFETRVESTRVESTREKFELEPEQERKPVPWRYRHFVEGVAAEKIVAEVGADPSRMARVFHKKDEVSGKDQVHVVGSPEVVKQIANGLESPKRELHTWYIGEAETVEEEREAVKPALEGLVREIPHPILSDAEIVEIATRAVGKALQEFTPEDINKAAKALNEFRQGGELDAKEQD